MDPAAVELREKCLISQLELKVVGIVTGLCNEEEERVKNVCCSVLNTCQFQMHFDSPVVQVMKSPFQ